MMEEYRYYDKIKRVRQDNLSIIKVVRDKTHENIDIKTILANCNFESTSRFLAKDESTEILETQRILSEEEQPLQKVIALLNVVKGK
ncbi:hypothetical protein D1872_282450 [compost metagenome]